jgi:hypothetical protein
MTGTPCRYRAYQTNCRKRSSARAGNGAASPVRQTGVMALTPCVLAETRSCQASHTSRTIWSTWWLRRPHKPKRRCLLGPQLGQLRARVHPAISTPKCPEDCGRAGVEWTYRLTWVDLEMATFPFPILRPIDLAWCFFVACLIPPLVFSHSADVVRFDVSKDCRGDFSADFGRDFDAQRCKLVVRRVGGREIVRIPLDWDLVREPN